MYRTIRYGSTGSEVRLLQQALNFQMCPPLVPLTVNGDFNFATVARLQEFQRRHNMPPDGIVGPATWRAVLPISNIAGRIMILPAVPAAHLIPPVPLSGNSVPSGNGASRAPSRLATPAPSNRGAAPPLSFPPDPETPSFAFGNVQVQGGRQFTFRPWVGRYTPGFASTVLTVQFTWLQRRLGVNLEGPHAELAFGAQYAENDAASDSRYTLTGFVQATAADLLQFGPVHLLSLFLQAGLNLNVDALGASLVLTAGNTITVDIIDGIFSIFLQGAAAVSVDVLGGDGNIAAQVLGGASLQWEAGAPSR